MNISDVKQLKLYVSRETIQRIEHFVRLLEKWNPRINLIAQSTVADIWTRHIVDAAQLLPTIPQGTRHYVDLGSGGGFPGLVVALIAKEKLPDLVVTLVESDTRKASFLRTVLRETGTTARVLAKRAEDIEPLDADIITARALADLSKLLGLVARHISDNGIALLQKGASWKSELADARKLWSFSLETKRSETNENSIILKIGDIAHV